ncbi:MAG TPA: hypothetical protein PLE73_03945 [Spirochaetota bacterium]|nr:hypothetical protein [Spirochaetota bacterium]HOS38295.1 hypothetical protein [Spirochaetota bacterium]HPI22321.1 hypothetical protein [Spirochaetota bacterium]HPU87835.1 hypothetical protein [Spirochaetota bacterium]
MRIRALGIIILTTVALASCISIDFVKTGKTYTALKPNADVIVFHRSAPTERYEEIGILRIDGGSLSKRIEVAKKVARQNGGNGLVPRGSGSDALRSVDSKIFEHESKVADAKGSERTQVFMVIRITDPEAERRAKEAEAKGPEGSPDKDSSKFTQRDPDKYYREGTDGPNEPGRSPERDPGKLPRATYRQLIENIDTMKGQRFAGALVPEKFYKIPRTLRSSAGPDSKLLMMRTTQRRQQVLVIVPADKAAGFKESIGSRSRVTIVYTPVDVHRFGGKAYPVLKLVDDAKK